MSNEAAASKKCPACGTLIGKKECVACGACFPSAATASSTKAVNKNWYDYLWVTSLLYLSLGLFNILYAWLGLICFFTPLLIAVFRKNKAYCHKYCGRAKLFDLLGGKLGLSLKRNCPKFLRSPWFRYGFLIFFMSMFALMIYSVVLVFNGAPLNESVTFLWTFNLPWDWTNTSFAAPWAAQFAFGFYGIMLSSTFLGLMSMFLFNPRSWCMYCPMGTMTQGICRF